MGYKIQIKVVEWTMGSRKRSVGKIAQSALKRTVNIREI